MIKYFIFGLLALSVGIFAGCVRQSAPTAVVPPVVEPTLQAAPPPVLPAPVSQEGISVGIQRVSYAQDKTMIDLALNNHQYDLATFDLGRHSYLAGIAPIDYQIKDSVVGGHHVLATLVFPGQLSGSFQVGLDDSLTFNFVIE